MKEGSNPCEVWLPHNTVRHERKLYVFCSIVLRLNVLPERNCTSGAVSVVVADTIFS